VNSSGVNSRRDLSVVAARDLGPWGPWLESIQTEASYAAHDLLTRVIIGLFGVLIGCVWTLFVLAALGVL
jgi:hypothetical protein